MRAKLDKVYVVDVEATCWETKEEQGALPNEVIEIGICCLEMVSGNISPASSYIVRPRFTTVSSFCTSLTGWTQERVDAGRDIVEVLEAVRKDFDINSSSAWFSCGEYDRVKLGVDGGGSLGALYGLERHQSPFAVARHFNIKPLFAFKHKLKREMGMARMLKHIDETLEGQHHSGADDAYNTAKIVRSVFS
jgi:inhibitor of KinA sporulation pathway (predicted exonuclease)